MLIYFLRGDLPWENNNNKNNYNNNNNNNVESEREKLTAEQKEQLLQD